jgi:broad specificity phosphatase PhoE
LQNLKKEHRGLRRRPLYTQLVVIVASLLVALLGGAWLVASWGSTTVVLVRHAEKQAAEEDPGLTEAGQARAQRLAAMLEGAGLAAIYVSEARRTQETAAPVAAATGLEPHVVPAARHGRLLWRLRWRHRGEVVLVIGHSNTIPVIAEGLGAPVGAVHDEEYSGFWIITYSRLRGTRLLTLHY